MYIAWNGPAFLFARIKPAMQTSRAISGLMVTGNVWAETIGSRDTGKTEKGRTTRHRIFFQGIIRQDLSDELFKHASAAKRRVFNRRVYPASPV